MATGNLSTLARFSLRAGGNSRWHLHVAGLAALAAAIAVRFVSAPAPEPAYAGKPITEWLDSGYEPAAMASQEVGPDALPWILKKLRQEHPRWDYRQGYGKLRNELPAVCVRFLPQPKQSNFDELRAANLLIGMGSSALPIISAGVKDSNPAVRSACGMALSFLDPKRAGEVPQLP